MPTAAPRACSRQPCPNFTPCPRHQAKRRWDGRAPARGRGYTYAWDKRSRELRAAGTLCGYCGVRPMAQLDHRLPLSEGGSQDPDVNGIPACDECHDSKTRAEGARAPRGS